MPKNKNTQHALTYGELSDFDQGYADALLRYFSNRDDAEAWSGIGAENLAPELLEVVRKDCRQFVVNMIESAVDENGSMEVTEGLYDHDLGRHLFLERMETGVGFGDLASVDDELRTQLIDAAGGRPDAHPDDLAPGGFVHEVGTARMGRDPATSVLNEYAQSWDVPNLFVVDGAAWPTSAWQNPTFTMMAVAGRASERLAGELAAGRM